MSGMMPLDALPVKTVRAFIVSAALPGGYGVDVVVTAAPVAELRQSFVRQSCKKNCWGITYSTRWML